MTGDGAGADGRAALSTARGALFDMDGLLLDTERLHLEAATSLAAELGLGDLSAVFLSMIGIRHLEGRELLRPALGGAVTLEAFEARWSASIGAALARGVPVRPGARELLERLAARGVPCAVATSTARAEAEAHLRAAGLRELVVSVTGGDEVLNPKPDPEIYHRAAATLGIGAHEAVAFEDSDPGTRAAIASGARTVQVPDLVRPSTGVLALGHVVAPDLLSGARRVGLL